MSFSDSRDVFVYFRFKLGLFVFLFAASRPARPNRVILLTLVLHYIKNKSHLPGAQIGRHWPVEVSPDET